MELNPKPMGRGSPLTRGVPADLEGCHAIPRPAAERPEPLASAPRPSPGPEAETALPSDVIRYAWGVVRALTRKYGWSGEVLEDLVQDLLHRLLRRRTPQVWTAFRRERFGDAEYLDAKATIVRTARQVIEKQRYLHKVAVRTGSSYYKEDADPSKRQRRTLPPDRGIGDRDAWVVDTRHGTECQRDLSLDMADAFRSLSPSCQEIVRDRIEKKLGWARIARAQNLTVPQTKDAYRRSIARLAERLEEYREGPAGQPASPYDA